jgi:predicted nucleic acid-binding protein
MNPLSPITQHLASPVNTLAPLQASDSQSGQAHPPVLPRAMMSHNTQSTLDQISAQTDVRSQLVASLVENGLTDGMLLLQSGQGSEAHYSQQVNVPDGLGGRTIGSLDVRAKLNENLQYDILNAQLQVPSSGATASISVSGPPPADQSMQSSAALPRRPSSATNLSTVSNEALMRELIGRHNPQESDGEQLPSGDSVSTQSQSRVFSNDGSAGPSAGVSGPSRTQPAHSARSAPYPAPSLSSRSKATSEGKRQNRPSATEAQIAEHLHNPDGSLRTTMGVLSALHAAGLGADNKRILAQLQAAGGAQHLSSATEAQIADHLYNTDGSLRTSKDVASALHAAGFGARNDRISAQLQAARGRLYLPSATEAQIVEHLHNANGSLRSTKDVLSALHAVGLGADDRRISAQLQAAGGARRLPGATEVQIASHLRNADGSLRIRSDVARALHSVGLGASKNRINAQLRLAKGARSIPAAADV